MGNVGEAEGCCLGVRFETRMGQFAFVSLGELSALPSPLTEFGTETG